ncbi:MAG: DUF4265 domain-containing protein [Myxococcales bacterium]|nr:DUF4265 domain-containing protein [Myxococcales bacterium]
MNKRDDAVEIQFDLETDGEGWPPIPVEPIWCTPVPSGDEHYTVTNVPIFAVDISRGDIIRAHRGQGGPMRFVALVEQGGHSTLRVIVANPDEVEAVAQSLASFGCVVNHTYIDQLLTLDLPPGVDYGVIRGWLLDADAADRVDWEEGALAAVHRVEH